MIMDFIEENFFYLHPGYTTFNTVVFGIVLGLIILGIIELFKRIDKDPATLIVPLIPMIIFGSTSRALVDNGVYPRIHLLATPGIYILIGIVTILLLLISIFLERYISYDYRIIIELSGAILCLPNIFLMLVHGINFNVMLLELIFFMLISSPFIILQDKINVINSSVNLSVLLAHIFDATSTFVAMDFFNYSEQHVLPTFMISLADTAFIMYPLKIILILSTLYVIDKLIDDDINRNMLKLAIFILGLAPGIRNFATLILSII